MTKRSQFNIMNGIVNDSFAHKPDGLLVTPLLYVVSACCSPNKLEMSLWDIVTNDKITCMDCLYPPLFTLDNKNMVFLQDEQILCVFR